MSGLADAIELFILLFPSRIFSESGLLPKPSLFMTTVVLPCGATRLVYALAFAELATGFWRIIEGVENTDGVVNVMKRE